MIDGVALGLFRLGSVLLALFVALTASKMIIITASALPAMVSAVQRLQALLMIMLRAETMVLAGVAHQGDDLISASARTDPRRLLERNERPQSSPNVLRGEMSSRPAPRTVQVQVDLTASGLLNGPASPAGRRSTAGDLPAWAHQRISSLTIWYIEHVSLALGRPDVLWRTLRMVLTGHGLTVRDGRLAGAAQGRLGTRSWGPCRCSAPGMSGSRRTPCRSSSGR